MKNQFIVIIILIFVVASFAPLISQQQWPMLNSCRERTSWAADENILHPPLKQVAQYIGVAAEYNELPTWYNNTLMVSIEHEPNLFVAWNDVTGDTLWTFPVPGTVGSVSFAGAQNDSMVFAGGQGGTGLYALDRTNGNIKWFKAIGSLYARNVIIDDDRLYLVVDSLYCLNIADGSTIWSYPSQAFVTPAVDDSCCYLAGDFKVVAFNKLTGIKKWEHENIQENYTTLMVTENRVYTMSNDSLVARDKTTGNIEWGYRVAGGFLPSLIEGGAAVCNDYVCFTIWANSGGLGELYTLNITDGSLLWKHTFSKEGAYGPVIANNVVYVVAFSDAELWGFDLHTGAELFFNSSYHFFGQPIVANNKLFAGTSTSTIVFANDETAVQENEPQQPQLYVQWATYPNPFNPATTIEFELPERAVVDIVIYDISGRTVRALLHESRPGGQHRLTWDGRNNSGAPVGSGVYLCKFSTDKGYSATKRMTLVK
ncbi:MAG TPA: PQQ-binding-like beta-propeller repeat protein [bacterium]|nr:PQQ-binding-like beta-propeller repeat protein [bacterium]HPN45445.1 PQQ-binding-like beta-propeller repeat protein [bacterium]